MTADTDLMHANDLLSLRRCQLIGFTSLIMLMYRGCCLESCMKINKGSRVCAYDFPLKKGGLQGRILLYLRTSTSATLTCPQRLTGKYRE